MRSQNTPLAPRWSRSTTWLSRALPLPALVAGATLAGLTATPAPVAAQATPQTPLATPAELVGTWVRTAWWADSAATLRPNEMIYTLRADGTASLGFRDRSAESTDKWVIGWGVRGDTLMMLSKWTAASKAEEKANANRLVITPQGDSMGIGERGQFTHTGDQLLWARLPGGSGTEFACADTLRRVDASKPLPSSPPGAITVDRAALIGTWVGVSGGPRDITRDTLTLRADSTSTFSSPGIRQTWTSPWRLHPGNILVDAQGANVIRAVKDGILTLTTSYTNPCLPELVYKRVSP